MKEITFAQKGTIFVFPYELFYHGENIATVNSESISGFVQKFAIISRTHEWKIRTTNFLQTKYSVSDGNAELATFKFNWLKTKGILKFHTGEYYTFKTKGLLIRKGCFWLNSNKEIIDYDSPFSIIGRKGIVKISDGWESEELLVYLGVLFFIISAEISHG